MFEPIYYLTLCAPTTSKTIEMVGKYVNRGATAVQLDLPAFDPVFETDLVKQFMKEALSSNSDYGFYLDVISEMRQKNPDTEINLVVYPQVVQSISFDKFVLFVKKEQIASVMIAGGDDVLSRELSDAKVTLIRRIDRNLLKDQLHEYSALDSIERYNFNYKRHSEIQPHGLVSFKEIIAYIRQAGVKGKVYAVEGVSSYSKLCEVKESGANGALIGNALMNLWPDEKKLWELFDSLQALAE